LNFKGYVALQAWRVSNWLWRRRRSDLALLLQSLSSDQLQVSIHPTAVDRHVGVSRSRHRHHHRRLRRDRRRGDDLQNVTIGRKHRKPTAPRKSAGEFILSAGSSIIGGVSIGDFAKIGAGAVVEHDVPPAAPRSAFPRG
jgi:serine O-acetyltransferase